MTTECEISPQLIGGQNGMTLEHDSPLSSPDSEQPNKGNTVRSDDSGIGMDDSHVFSMDQSAMSDDLNATTPEEDDKSPSSPSFESPPPELADNSMEHKDTEEEEQNRTETEVISEISQPSEPQEETQATEVTEEEVTRICITRQKTTPFGDIMSESDIRQDDIPEVQSTSEVKVTTTVTETDPDGTELTTTKTVVTRTEVEDTEPEVSEPEVIEDTIIPMKKEKAESLLSDECEVKITVTEAEEPPAEEEVVPEPEPEPEVERVDFVKGMVCSDVTTALEILKTRYRLSDVHVKKCIITWSCWNLPDLVIKRPLSDWKGSPDEVPDLPENEALKGMVQDINTKEDEIDKLVKEVLKADEDKKKDDKQQGKPTNQKTALEPVQEEAITVDAAPEQESAPPAGEEEPKKKKRNVFSRMIHALRKRLSGKRSRA